MDSGVSVIPCSSCNVFVDLARREPKLSLSKQKPDDGRRVEQPPVFEDAVWHVGRHILEKNVDVAYENSEKIDPRAETAEEKRESEKDPRQIWCSVDDKRL